MYANYHHPLTLKILLKARCKRFCRLLNLGPLKRQSACRLALRKAPENEISAANRVQLWNVFRLATVLWTRAISCKNLLRRQSERSTTCCSRILNTPSLLLEDLLNQNWYSCILVLASNGVNEWLSGMFGSCRVLITSSRLSRIDCDHATFCQSRCTDLDDTSYFEHCTAFTQLRNCKVSIETKRPMLCASFWEWYSYAIKDTPWLPLSGGQTFSIISLAILQSSSQPFRTCKDPPDSP